MISLADFVDNYLKEHDLKLLAHQKSMMKSINEGKMIYYGRGEKSSLGNILQAYEKYKEDV